MGQLINIDEAKNWREIIDEFDQGKRISVEFVTRQHSFSQP